MTDAHASTDGGTYTLVVELPSAVAVAVGALGRVEFDAGWYAYVGSALGSGGFARIDRHRRVAAGEHDVRHWHVDYLLGETDARIDAVVRSRGVDAECAVADALAGDRVSGFGASDCDCDSHLAVASTRERLLASVEAAHEAVRDEG